MKNKNTKWILFRWLGYILIPVLIFIITLNGAVIYTVSNNSLDDFDDNNYYESDFFLDQLESDLKNMVIEANNTVITDDYSHYSSHGVIDINGEKYEIINSYLNEYQDFDFIYVDNVAKEININKLDVNIKEIIEDESLGDYYYTDIDNVITSTIGDYDVKDIVINYGILNQYNFENLENADFYYSYDNIEYTSTTSLESIWYNIVKGSYKYAVLNICIAALLLLTLTILMFIGIGKNRENDDIKLNKFDNIPFELIVFAGMMPLFIGINSMDDHIVITTVMLSILYIIWLNILITFIKRIKASSLLKSTLIYKSIILMKSIFTKVRENVKITAIIVGFVFINFFLIVTEYHPFIMLIYIAVLIGIGIYVYKRYFMLKNIKQLINDIYENKTYTIKKEDYTEDFYEVVEKLDKISNGFNEALESKLVSERMKSELITNVSHDIKTPLTSIINYIDLLQKEKIEDKKINEYINILSIKADRLKKLTEDLVELSKASSGNLKIGFSKININELLNQLNGEYDEKIKTSKLEIDYENNKNIFIKADTKYIYRVFDNIYSNIVKYSMKNTRVYLDIKEADNEVIISIKNISKEKLNISKEELIQRFVRGDSSRSEQGSGLGLSIVDNLVKLQEGNFDITIDGDLFKVIITFKKW